MFAREHITDAIRFWEVGRIVYNVVLVAESLILFYLAGGVDSDDWPAVLQVLFFLAVVANAFYCFAYPIDLLVQASDFRKTWRGMRWALWLLGALTAGLLAFWTLGGPYIVSSGHG